MPKIQKMGPFLGENYDKLFLPYIVTLSSYENAFLTRKQRTRNAFKTRGIRREYAFKTPGIRVEYRFKTFRFKRSYKRSVLNTPFKTKFKMTI